MAFGFVDYNDTTAKLFMRGCAGLFALIFPLKSKGYPTCLSTHYQAVIGFTVHDMRKRLLHNG